MHTNLQEKECIPKVYDNDQASQWFGCVRNAYIILYITCKNQPEMLHLMQDIKFFSKKANTKLQ
jgi:hypothetical protein